MDVIHLRKEAFYSFLETSDSSGNDSGDECCENIQRNVKASKKKLHNKPAVLQDFSGNYGDGDYCESGKASKKKPCSKPADSSGNDSGDEYCENIRRNTKASKKKLHTTSADSSGDDLDHGYCENIRHNGKASKKMLHTKSADSSGSDTDDDYCENIRGNGKASKKKLCSKPAGRKYIQWNVCDTQMVLSEFKEFIEGDIARKLPSRQQIEDFKLKHGVKLDWITIKTKVFNERNKQRRIAQKRMKEMNMP